MRVLIVGAKTNGVTYHRLFMPYGQIERTTDIEFFATPQIDTITIQEVESFDAIIFNRNISQKFDPAPIYVKCKAAGTKLILDIDDHWNLYPGHVLFSHYQQTNSALCCIDQLKDADFITTTNGYLRDEIIKLGIDKKKVTICRNAIDSEEKQFKQEFTKENKMFWQGSTTHALDLELLSDIEEPITLGGYFYSDEWFNMCAKIKQPLIKNNLPVDEYMNLYNETSIALIPLKDNKFNRSKSELKMIEAGWAHKAVVVSDVEPYRVLIDNGVNCFVAKSKADFKKYSELLLKNEDLQVNLAGELHELIKSRYLIENVNIRRLDILEQCRK